MARDEAAVEGRPGRRFRLARSGRGVRLPRGTVLFVALSLANVSNYLFQVVASRLLGPSRFSLLGGLFAVVTVVTVSTSALQAAAAKAVAAQRATGEDDGVTPWTHEPLSRATARGSVIALLPAAMAVPLVMRFMRSDAASAAALLLYMVGAPLLSVALGRLQGMEAFTVFAAVGLALAVLRLALLPAVVVAGLGVAGVVALGGALTIAAALVASHLARRAGPIPLAGVRHDIGRATAALVLFWAMVSIDVPVARHWLASDRAGQYAAAAVIGKAVLWLPSAIALIMFPRVTLLREQGSETHQPLVWSLGLTGGLCVFGVVGLAAFGSTVLPLFFGDQYHLASTYAWKVGAAELPFALANVLIFYHLTRDTGRFIGALAAAMAVQLGLYALDHGSLDQIVLVTAAAGWVLVIGLLVPGSMRRLRHRIGRSPSDRGQNLLG